MFKLRQDVREGQLRSAVLNNSLTVKVGDAIVPLAASNAVTNATAVVAGDKYPIGIVVGFSGPNGEVISQGQNPINTPNQITTASDNLTVAKYRAVYLPITSDMEFSATLSGTAGTTAGSDTAFVWFNLSDAATLDETSVLVYTDGSAPLQVLSYGLDPLDTTNKTAIVKFVKFTGHKQ